MNLADTQLARRNRELAILAEIAAALNREVDLVQALEVTLRAVAELFGLRTGWVWLLNQHEQPYLAAAQQLPPALANVPERMAGSCYCLDAYCAGGLDNAANVNIITCSRLKKLVDGTDGLRYHASIPLYAHGRKIGVMNVAGADWGELAPEDLRLLFAVGDLLGMAVERTRLFEQQAELGALEERNRLAREIHDTLAQGMTAVALQLETADALLDAAPERARTAVQQALYLTQRNLAEARRSVLNLRADMLNGRSIGDALRALAEEQAARSHLALNVEVSGGERPVAASVSFGLYRIAQQALANVIQHAEAHTLVVQLNIQLDMIVLRIIDDGRGFDATTVPAGHFGIVGMRERAKLMGGELRVASSPGVGTEVVCEIGLGSE